MTLRGAYVEFNMGHGELQPTFWWIARELGIELDFHVLTTTADLDPLGTVPGPHSLTRIVVDDPHDPIASPVEGHEFADISQYDFYVLGTPEPDDRIAAMARLDRPQLHLHHNTDPNRPMPVGVTRAVLAPHVHDLCPDPTVLIEPLYTGEHPIEAGADDPPTRVSVPGNLDASRRNYGSLVRALKRLQHDGLTPDRLRIDLVGRSSSPASWEGRGRFDTARVRRRLESDGVGDFVSFSDHELTYPELHRKVAACPFVAPLVDDFYTHTRRYVHGKHTASTAVGMGGGSIPLLNASHADALGIEIGPRYRLDGLAPALLEAIEWPDVAATRSRIVELRNRRLAASARAFGEWVESAT